MKILGIEASGLVASAALLENDSLKAEFTINNRMTHSQTLLPMVEEMLKLAGEDVHAVDAIAVSAGPGSFTGLRIGAATAKGLALAVNRPMIKVSSLEAMAYSLSAFGTQIVCPIMDARRGQVYCAAYQNSMKLLPEAAADIHVYLQKLAAIAEASEDEPTFVFLGDGVPVHEMTIAAELPGEIVFATAEANRQRAANVAVLGKLLYQKWLRKNGLSAEEVRAHGADGIECFDEVVMNTDEFVPEYLRKPQAEREKEAGLLEDPGLHSLKKIAKGEKR